MIVFAHLMFLISSVVGWDDSVVICGTEDTTAGFRKAIYEFTVPLCQLVSKETKGQYAFSALSIWMTLAAFAERSQGPSRQELFNVLRLPEDECTRQNYYQLSLQSLKYTPDVNLPRTRLYLVDESVKVNNDWQIFAKNHFELTTRTVPLKRDPKLAAIVIRDAISSYLPNLDFGGDSVLLDSLDYHGLWTEGFPEMRVAREPFYDAKGVVIGAVDMMRSTRRIRMVKSDNLKATIAEIPVGQDEKYKMIVAMGENITGTIAGLDKEVLIGMLMNLNDTGVPVEIGIPRFSTVSELDVRTLVEGIGVKSFWTDSAVTGNITIPTTSPSTFIQRVTATIENRGVSPPLILHQEQEGFIANKPFMYCLLDSTYTVLFSGGFSQPTYWK